MTDKATTIETLFERVQNYSLTSIELFKLNAIEKSSDVTATLISRIVIFMVVALSVTIINIGIAFWLADVLGKTWYGFILVGLINAFVGLMLFLFRHQLIKNPIQNAMIKKMQKPDEDDANDS